MQETLAARACAAKIGGMARKSSRPSAALLPDDDAQNPEGTGLEAMGSATPTMMQPGIGVPGQSAISDTSLTGQVLIAMPSLDDPRFQHSVIFMCAHTAEGAMGIVINRPLAQPSFEDLLRQLEVAPVPPARTIRLCSGGPVDNARGFVLHSADWTGEGSLRVNAEMALTASLDVLKAIAEGGGPQHGLLALGYSGWGPGQLDNEIQQNAWLSAPADATLLFDGPPDTAWRRALAKLRVDPALLTGAAGHA
jgi:putative transcriptional regulator